MSENNVVVIDPGSLVLKAGYGGEDTPSVTINNAIGFSKEQEEKDNFLCGEELQAKKEALSIKYPVVDGIVTNIDDFEKILQYVFDNELKITPEENNILLSESIVNPKPIREKMGQILFETFNSLSVYIAAQPLLALYSAGCTTGVVVDIGDGICHTTPFNEGYVVHSGVYNTSLSGKKLTEYLSELLAQKGNYNINIEKIREIKEELCFTSFDYEEQTRKMGLKSNDIDRNYVLPDGQVINLGVERFKCAELLFKPQLFGIESIGIHETIYNSLASCDPETRSEVAQHIVITGGTSTMTGFQDRLQRELTALSPLRYKMKVNTTSERKYGVWNGGSILGSLNAFQNMWITKQDYDETGPTIVNRKCF